MRQEIRVAGQGGQGAITVAYVIGRAATLFEKKQVIMTEAYGPEITGGFARADLIISDEEIEYPMVNNPEYLMVLSSESWEMNGHLVEKGGTVLYEDFLVKPEKDGKELIGVSAIKEAEEIGKKVVANIVMLGAFIELTGIVSKESIEKALVDVVPKNFIELNLKAIRRGYELGRERRNKK